MQVNKNPIAPQEEVQPKDKQARGQSLTQTLNAD